MAHFVLTMDPVNTAAAVAVWAVIYDAAGSVVGRFAAHAGESRSSGTLLLAPGDYRLELTAARPDGGWLPEVGFQLLGKTISLPIGPGISDPTRAPMLPSSESRRGGKQPIPARAVGYRSDHFSGTDQHAESASPDDCQSAVDRPELVVLARQPAGGKLSRLAP